MTNIEDQVKDLANLRKYKLAGRIANKVLNEVIKKCKEGSNTKEICKYGDREIIKESKRQNVSGNVGIGFPTCISINNEVGQCVNEKIIKEKDIVKIELGVHIDGFIAVVGYTLYIKKKKKEEEKKSLEEDERISLEEREEKIKKILKALSEAGKEIYKNMKPGKTNKKIQKILESKEEKYECKIPIYNEEKKIPGIISYQISRNIIDGNNENEENMHRMILSKENEKYGYTMQELELEENEVYIIDIVYGTTSKIYIEKKDTHIYKKTDIKNELKLRSSKEVMKKFDDKLPKNMEKYSNDGKIRLGIRECINKKVIEEYPATKTKNNEIVGRIKFTVIVKKEPILICGKSIDEEIKKLN